MEEGNGGQAVGEFKFLANSDAAQDEVKSKKHIRPIFSLYSDDDDEVESELQKCTVHFADTVVLADSTSSCYCNHITYIIAHWATSIEN